MQSNKNKSLLLPPIKEDLSIPIISAHQIQPCTAPNALRSKTQPLQHHSHKFEFASFIRSQKPDHHSQHSKSVPQQNSKGKQKTMGQVGKCDNVSELIDTRKSIKILLDYFDSKSQQEKNRNANCYHSPRRQSDKQAMLVYSADRPAFIGRKIIQLKKIKLKKAKIAHYTDPNHSPLSPRKQKACGLNQAIKIENVATDNLSNNVRHSKHQQSHRERSNLSQKKNSGYVVKIKGNQKGVLLQRKMTKFQGWPVDYETNYIQ